MNNAAYADTGNFWNRDFFTPQPTQDSDLIKQLHFIPGLKEILMLRQTHALEHATVWVLSETANFPQLDHESLGGLSTDQGFYLYGKVDKIHLQRAVALALCRLQDGEWDLALHPRCGTNLSVAVLLTSAFAVGTGLLLPKGLLEQLLGLTVAATAATQLAPDLGNLVQKYLTTSIPFNLKVEDIAETPDMWGRSAYFVRVQWREPQ